MSEDIKPEYISLPQAAKYLSISLSTVRRWAQSGKLPVYRVGEKAVRVKISDLEKMIEPIKPGEVSEDEVE